MSLNADFRFRWQIVFEGVVGFKGYGDYAIDDVIVRNGLCPEKGHCDFEGNSLDR